MCVGDLVRWKPNLPFTYTSDFGIIVQIIDDYLVGVLWNDGTHVYLEDKNNLEVINESR